MTMRGTVIGLCLVGIFFGVILAIIGLSRPGENFLTRIAEKICDRYFPTILLATIILVIISATVVGAGENGSYWKINAIWILKSPAGDQVRVTEISNPCEPGEFEYFHISPFDKACEKINKLQPRDLVWVDKDENGKLYLNPDRQPPASVELGRGLINR